MANVDRLKQVRMAIINFEENFNYKYYYSRKGLESSLVPRNVNKEELFTHTCGTCACVAGFALALYNPEPGELGSQNDTWDIAQEYLALSYPESEWLFTPYNGAVRPHTLLPSLSGYKYQDESEFPGYNSCTQEQGYAEALRRLDHLIEYYSNANSN